MLLEIFGFLRLSFADIVDILVVAALISVLIRWIRGSSAMNIFIAILMLLATSLLAESLNMRLMSAILKTVLDVGVIALVVIFQPEIRHFLIRLGSRSGLTGKWRNLANRLLGISETANIDGETAKEITEACRMMSEDRTGALIVLPGENPLQQIVETGDTIDARVSRRLILNIFFKNSPLHDGAMIISSDRIIAARCTLPITSRTDIPASYGMRHKAAIGMSEESDASIIVVSEETGGISFIRSGNLTKITNINELTLLLSQSRQADGAQKKEEEND